MKLDIRQRALIFLLTLRHISVMWFSNFNSESIITPSNFSWELAAIEIPSTETISGFLELSKIWDFPGLAFKWLFLNQRKSLVAEACNSNATLGLSVAHHCVKSVQIRSYFWSVFSSIGTGYGEIINPNTVKYGPEITPYLDSFHAVHEYDVVSSA